MGLQKQIEVIASPYLPGFIRMPGNWRAHRLIVGLFGIFRKIRRLLSDPGSHRK